MSDARVANKLGLAPLGPMAATLEDVPRIVGELEAQLKDKLNDAYAYAHVSAACSVVGWSIYVSYNTRRQNLQSKSFVGRCGQQTFDDLVAEMREWLATDDDALANLTLGLTADGRFAEGT